MVFDGHQNDGGRAERGTSQIRGYNGDVVDVGALVVERNEGGDGAVLGVDVELSPGRACDAVEQQAISVASVVRVVGKHLQDKLPRGTVFVYGGVVNWGAANFIAPVEVEEFRRVVINVDYVNCHLINSKFIFNAILIALKNNVSL